MSDKGGIPCKMYIMSDYKYVTVAEKTDHLAQVSDFEILVPRCSALFTLCKGVVRIALALSVLE